ncbi:MAG: type III-B CRISPR module RAMP protein Cmr4 [Brevinematia bacterium]|jgi:CRISPR-associated protein Cmr4
MAGKFSSADLVLLRTITNLHVGTGKGGEIADLPIQRDSYGFPTIYSSSLKGAIKSYFYHKYNKLADLLFGSDEAGEFSSPIALTDAFLLAFPVRSLKGVYCYLTCPFLLKRFKEFTELAGYKFGNEIQKILENPPVYSCDNPDLLTIMSEKKAIVINEELTLEGVKANDNVNKLRSFLSLDKELIIIDDDECLYQSERSLIRLTRVRLKRESKTVEAGPWNEEYVPPKTLFFSAIYYSLPNENIQKRFDEVINKVFKKSQLDLTDMISYIRTNLKTLIIGGHETIGSGVVSFKFMSKVGEE